LETPAAAKTRIRHCYNRPQTIRRLSSQKTHYFQRRKTNNNNNNNKQKLSHPRTQIPTTVTYCKKNTHTHTHTHKPSNKQTRKAHPPKEYKSPKPKYTTQKTKTRQINFTTNTSRRRRRRRGTPPQQQQLSKH
jgi:hypothetical protein